MFRHTMCKVAPQLSAQGVLLCCRAFSLGSFGPRESSQTSRKRDGEAKKGGRWGCVSVELIFPRSPVLEPSFLSSRHGSGHELCMGRV